MREVVQKIATSVTEEPILVLHKTPRQRLEKFVSKYPWLIAFLNWFGAFIMERKIEIKALSLGTLYRISKAIMEMEITRPDKENLNNWAFKTIKDNAYALAVIVATAIHNHKSQVPQRLIDWILENFTPEEIKQVVQAIREDIDIASFITTISSTRSLNLMSEELSPQDTGEIIAPGEQSEAL